VICYVFVRSFSLVDLCLVTERKVTFVLAMGVHSIDRLKQGAFWKKL